MPESAPSSLSRFDRLWLTEAVRLREEHAGLLEDAEANRLARAEGGDIARRIETRALFLARRDGLIEAQRHWRQGAWLAGWALVLLALFGGAGLALGALGDSQQPLNIFWALASLLGLNLATLLGWALGLALSADNASALGRLWLWLGEKLARDARAAQLAPSLLTLLQRRRLARWLLGTGIHGLWSLAMASALVLLTVQLATLRYGFVWQTTLLGDDTFVALTQGLGRLPALLGAPLPSEAQIRASGALGADLEALKRVWAGWLLGVVAVYGLLPRLLLTVLCYWRWRAGQARLAVDPQEPGYRLLRERLEPPSERLGVCDPAPATLHRAEAAHASEVSAGALLVGIELDDRRPWPPRLPAGVAEAGVLDDRLQRQRLLEQLTRQRPARLLIACDPLRSPDRGSLALIAELSRQAGQTRVWLLPAEPGLTPDPARLADWQQALDELGLPYSGALPRHWLEHGHD